MKTQTKNYQAGFSLIEYIVALVIAAIMAAMVYTFFGNALTQSSVPITRLKSTSNLHKVMENIVADYNRLNALNLRYKWQATVTYSVGNVVVPSTSNGYYYTRLTAGSGGTEPTHTTGTGPESTWKVGGVIWNATVTPVENIVWRPSPQTYSLNNLMIPIKNDGHYYRCTSTTTYTSSTSSTTSPSTWVASTAYVLGDLVRPSSYNGHYYRCSIAGTSGTAESAWSTVAMSTKTDGTVTWTEAWTEAGTILYRSDSTILSSPGLEAVLNDNIYNYLKNNPTRYGTGYSLVTAVANQPDFIQFDGTNTQVVPGTGTPTTSTEKNILKVTIQDSTTGETLTQLFTIR